MLLHDKLKPYRLILASRSPRRRQLLEACRLDFETAVDYEVEERYPDTLPPEEVPAYLSQLKSDAYPGILQPDSILITADTVVVSEGKIIGKPRNRAEAVHTLENLSGRTHRVITGVTLRNDRKRVSFEACSQVRFRPLSEEEIVYYIDTFRPYDKAGAYGIQEWIGYIGIESIEGSFHNVMGLPVQKLYTTLEKFIGI